MFAHSFKLDTVTNVSNNHQVKSLSPSRTKAHWIMMRIWSIKRCPQSETSVTLEKQIEEYFKKCYRSWLSCKNYLSLAHAPFIIPTMILSCFQLKKIWFNSLFIDDIFIFHCFYNNPWVLWAFTRRKYYNDLKNM